MDGKTDSEFDTKINMLNHETTDKIAEVRDTFGKNLREALIKFNKQ